MKGLSLELEVTSLAPGGDGVARSPEGLAVFVPHSAPGDKVRARITEAHKTYLRARVEEVLRPGPARVPAPCSIAGRCGGCAWQHLDPKAQADSKQSFLAESLKRIGGFAAPPLEPFIAAKEGYIYRNKAQVPVALGPDGKLRLGYYKEGSHDVVPLPPEGCRLLLPGVNDALLLVRDSLASLGIKPYDQKSGEGSLRHVMARANTKGQVMVVLVTREPLGSAAKAVAKSWRGQAGIVSVLNNIQAKTGNVVLGDETKILAGDEALQEELDGLRYRLSATSFFQVNTAQTKALLKALRGLRSWAPGEQLLELYCGVGTLSLPLGRLGLRLHGTENHAAAVEDAKANAQLNGMGQALSFAVAEAEAAGRDLPEGFTPSLALVDPPRKGLGPAVVAALAGLASVKELVYVSCDPASLARDLKALVQAGFRLEKVQGVDLFPQTPHVESLSLLRR